MGREEGVAEEFAKRSNLLSFILLLGLIYLVGTSGPVKEV